MSGSVAEPLRIEFDKRSSPLVWISEILNKADGKFVEEVAQRLVEATLVVRYPDRDIPNFHGHTTNLQSRRCGDFLFDTASYHVSASDGKEAIPRCKQNLETGILPVILVPREQAAKAIWRAENEGILDRVSIFAIEEFITQNIIELSTSKGEDLLTTLQTIVSEYNRRLQEVGTDMSLKIEIHWQQARDDSRSSV